MLEKFQKSFSSPQDSNETKDNTILRQFKVQHICQKIHNVLVENDHQFIELSTKFKLHTRKYNRNINQRYDQ